jgi:hypothetical protein
VESCRADLLKWGARFDKNTNRPYFEGHERDDVKTTRIGFIKYFLDNKEFYFYPFMHFGSLTWNIPLRKKRILISHDESTFRSGEMSAFKWIFPENVPFFNKGRGQSIMLSLFMIQHNSNDIFQLSETEWEKAIKKYPDLNRNSVSLNFFPRSANAWIQPKKDNYFDNAKVQQIINTGIAFF